MDSTNDVEFAMAMPSAIGVHSTIALAGTYSPENPTTANDPGLNQANVFTDVPKSKGKTMLAKHWLLIGLALLAVWYFFFRGSSSSLATAAA